MLGILAYDISTVRFTPLLEPPDCIPSARLSLPLTPNERWQFLECRHGLVLLINRTHFELTVWDPVTGGQRCFAIPPDFVTLDARTAALLCDDSKRTFRVVLLRHDDVPEDDGDAQVFASVYESESGVWGSLISASITAPIWLGKASILAGNSLCWWLRGRRSSGILEFDMDTQSLAVIDIPVDADVNSHSSFQILRMQDNRLGLAIVTDQSIQLWMRKEGSGGVPRWMLQKTVQLDNRLSLLVESKWLVIMGYDEDGHVIFIWTNIGVFMIQLESLQFRNLFKTNIINNYHPYTCFYTIQVREYIIILSFSRSRVAFSFCC
ncbi:hypothetical protein PR202_gb27434 [Eleusine coracana subsp. coracana]|uniref:F-box protein AT5G49610-like beta-propeller domain-containing protein n=1 Tax=Eleusine coracana subsp. coracana TaxID=191504 RepID=A0AAV5FRM5_ELECO|nr:hypothetical protein PR202_gb27434 [Eleusine coracana subsp. coracana]